MTIHFANVALPSSVRYLGDIRTRAVHDLHWEAQECKTARIVAYGDAVAFSNDTSARAHAEGFHRCEHCVRSR